MSENKLELDRVNGLDAVLSDLEVDKKNAIDVIQKCRSGDKVDVEEAEDIVAKLESHVERAKIAAKAEANKLIDETFGAIEADKLAEVAGCKNLNLHIRKSTKTKSAMEECLVAQFSALHQSSMRFIAHANHVMDNFFDEDIVHKLNNMAIKSSKACNNIAMTLSRLESGGQQKILVKHQHVQVNDGGQAVVAGNKVVVGGGNEK